MMSGRLVAATRKMPARLSMPSISVSSWLTTLHHADALRPMLQAARSAAQTIPASPDADDQAEHHAVSCAMMCAKVAPDSSCMLHCRRRRSHMQDLTALRTVRCRPLV